MNAERLWMTLMYATSWILSLMPQKMLDFCGLLLGWIWYYLIPIRKKWVICHLKASNLRLKTPQKVARRHLVEISRSMVALWAWPKVIRTHGDWPKVQIQGQKYLSKALSLNRGVILVSAHLGYFDLIALKQAYLKTFGKEMHVISKNLTLKSLNHYWQGIRKRMGLNILSGADIFKRSREILKRGEIIIIVLDQHSTELNAFEHPFLGILARTTSLMALLALKTKAPVLPCFTLPQEDGEHLLWFEAPLNIQGQNRMQKRDELTRQALLSIEKAIQRRPESWLWLHRRWKDKTQRPRIDPKYSCSPFKGS